MKLSDNNLKTILIHIHKRIEETADNSVEQLIQNNFGTISYPPNGGLTEKEIEGLKKLKIDDDARSGLRKVIADSSAFIIFDFLSIVDRVAEPEINTTSWTGIKIVDESEDIKETDDMLHDSLYETYWDWRKLRENKNWKLDNYEG